MSNRHRTLLNLFAGTVFAALPLGSAWAQQTAPQSAQNDGRARAMPPQQQRGSLSDAVRRVERNTRGEVLSAERVQYDGRDMHRVKVVDDRGRVRVYMRDPARRDGSSQVAKKKDD